MRLAGKNHVDRGLAGLVKSRRMTLVGRPRASLWCARNASLNEWSAMRVYEPGVRRATSLACQGFTLIELLIVVAIIVLLIAILIPSLSDARQQAKQVKCLSNEKQIGTAMLAYFSEERDWFPFEKRNEVTPSASNPQWMAMHGFYFAGHPGRQDYPGSEQWWGYVQEPYRDTPAGRPFNKYIYPNLPAHDYAPDDPQFELVRQMPVFECPSDDGSFWMFETGDNPNCRSLYWFSGNSYDSNYHFSRCWAAGAFMDEAPIRWLQRANAYLRVQLQRNSSTFVIIFEDPFDSAQWNRIPRMGWHRKWNRHTVIFLDGHAASMVTNTAAGSRGLGWKSGSGNAPDDPGAWWNDPEDPDYSLRDITPLAGQ